MGQEADLDAVMARMTADFLAQNSAGRMLRRALDDVGVGFIPVIDHVTIRTMDIDRRAEEFLALGYRYDETLHFDDWYAKVFRWAGYPALFVDQAYPDDRGKTSIIPRWVEKFGDQVFHHVAVRVEDIEQAILKLKAKGVVFAGEIGFGRPLLCCRDVLAASSRRPKSASTRWVELRTMRRVDQPGRECLACAISTGGSLHGAI